MLEYSRRRRKQMTETAVTVALPFWKFMSAGDGRVCEICAALDGFVAPWNDAIWDRLFAPVEGEPDCRCIVVAILRDEAPPGASEPAAGRLPAAVKTHLKL
jgi:SPP1 gp7 family putative phage head morphogenesis protein